MQGVKKIILSEVVKVNVMNMVYNKDFFVFRVDRHFSGNHQNDEDEAKESYL